MTDPSGAVLPGAKVSVTSEGEGTVREMTTGSTGVYTVANLTVGKYRLQANATGFGTYDRTGNILSANQVFNVDVKMTLAQAGTSVQVQAAIAKNYGNQLTFNAGYTWAKDLTDTQEGTFSGQTIQNQFDRRSEYANNLITPPHRVYGYAIWQIPVGQGHHLLNRSGIVEAALGGWQMAWNAMAQSGQFFTPSFSGFDPSDPARTPNSECGFRGLQIFPDPRENAPAVPDERG